MVKNKYEKQIININEYWKMLCIPLTVTLTPQSSSLSFLFTFIFMFNMIIFISTWSSSLQHYKNYGEYINLNRFDIIYFTNFILTLHKKNCLYLDHISSFSFHIYNCQSISWPPLSSLIKIFVFISSSSSSSSFFLYIYIYIFFIIFIILYIHIYCTFFLIIIVMSNFSFTFPSLSFINSLQLSLYRVSEKGQKQDERSDSSNELLRFFASLLLFFCHPAYCSLQSSCRCCCLRFCCRCWFSFVCLKPLCKHFAPETSPRTSVQEQEHEEEQQQKNEQQADA